MRRREILKTKCSAFENVTATGDQQASVNLYDLTKSENGSFKITRISRPIVATFSDFVYLLLDIC